MLASRSKKIEPMKKFSPKQSESCKMKKVLKILMQMSKLFFVVLLFWIFNSCDKNSDIDPSQGLAFDKDKIDETFISMYQLYPSKLIQKSNEPYVIPINEKSLPQTYSYYSDTRDIDDWMEKTQTTALIVIKDDTIKYEQYFRKHSENEKHIAFSVSKSYISLLIGIAVENGFINSINDNAEKYVPNLIGSGYEGSRIKDILQMSSGVKFDEDYSNPNSDVNKMSEAADTGSINEFLKTLNREKPTGTYHQYKSADTQVLAWILASATGKSITELTQQYIWEPLGMENDGYWLVDSVETELGYGGLNATSRDFAKLGLLYLNNGQNYKGKQIVLEEWIKNSYTTDGSHIEPGTSNNSNSSSPLGYGYQFWIVPTLSGPIVDYLAIGIYGQFIYINREKKIVIVKNSAYYDYNNSGEDMETEAFFALRSIANTIE